MTDEELEQKALAKLKQLLLAKGSPCKKWRKILYFDVPGYIMQNLYKKGLCRYKKDSPSSPNMYSP